VIVDLNGATLDGSRMVPGKVSGFDTDENGEPVWALVDGLVGDVNYDTDMIDVRSMRHSSDNWERPQNITIKNGNILGSIRINGMSNHDLERHSKQENFTTIARNNAPKHIILDNLTITSPNRIPLYLRPGVSEIQLINSEIKGESGAVAIYLDHESYSNTIKNNYIHAATSREVIAIDGSSHNKIMNNTFAGLNNGGIYLYRNCGERGVVRHSPPEHNEIVNNIFYYNKYKGPSPAVYFGSRNGKTPGWNSYCGKDEETEYVREYGYDPFGEWGYNLVERKKEGSNLYGSSLSDLDYARYNVVMQNQFYEREVRDNIDEFSWKDATIDDMIKTKNSTVNSPNYCGISHRYLDRVRLCSASPVDESSNQDESFNQMVPRYWPWMLTLPLAVPTCSQCRRFKLFGSPVNVTVELVSMAPRLG